jgi:hypothetical protein
MSDLLVGERVHGCEISSSKLASIWEDRRIGFGASILFSWLSVSSVLVTGGGVLRRGIPAQITNSFTCKGHTIPHQHEFVVATRIMHMLLVVLTMPLLISQYNKLQSKYKNYNFIKMTMYR